MQYERQYEPRNASVYRRQNWAWYRSSFGRNSRRPQEIRRRPWNGFDICKSLKLNLLDLQSEANLAVCSKPNGALDASASERVRRRDTNEVSAFRDDIPVGIFRADGTLRRLYDRPSGGGFAVPAQAGWPIMSA